MAIGMIPVAAWGLTLVEILGGLLVLAKRPSGLWLISGLLLIFMGALLYGLWLGLDIDCGCLGPLESEGSSSLSSALARDLLLLAVCLTLLLRRVLPAARSSKDNSQST